jgi:glycerate kinase
MKILLIPDKFKGSLTAQEVIEAMSEGVRHVDPAADITSVTASDGGDGFLDSIRGSTRDLELIECSTTDPLGRPITAAYLHDANNNAAYIEMAKASGMELLKADERNPCNTSTVGTGKLIAEAVRRGAKTIYVGLGGSATNDAATGIAAALGFRFLDSSGKSVEPSGGHLGQIEHIDASGKTAELQSVQIFAINDVQNPLLGPQGASKVYARQKGADDRMVAELESGMQHLASVVQRELGIDAADVRGAGAAGGAGYGLKVFLDAEFLSGIEFILRLAGVESQLTDGSIDTIITGEGRIDDQTAYGKLVRGVAKIGADHEIPVDAICGQLNLVERTIKDIGLRRAMEIHNPARPLEDTIANAKTLVAQATEELIRKTLES